MSLPVLLVPGAAAEIRAYLRASGRRIAVLDDDPTGSQAVHGVSVVTVLEPEQYAAAVEHPGDTCFVLTNTRSMAEDEAVATNERVATDLYRTTSATSGPLELVSRGDSTLRGHVVAEVEAIAAARTAAGLPPADGVLFCPAMLDAGRYTVDDVHMAVVDSVHTPVAETEFARDRAFGYTTSNLREFLAERSAGRIRAAEVASLSLADIRLGGPAEVGRILSGISDGRWVVVNATHPADLEVVALGLQIAQRAGRTFLVRSAPSFVRALAGIEAREPLTVRDIAIGQGRSPYGLIVVGSHVGLSTRQLDAAVAAGGLTAIEVDVPNLLRSATAAATLDRVAGTATAAMAGSDVVISTSRTVAALSSDPSRGLDIARTVSAALVDLVGRLRPVRPAWVIAKGGITSHDLAARALGIRRATVLGQFLPGQISLMMPVEAPADVLGCPFVAFPGNVGQPETLAVVRARLVSATGDRADSCG